MFELLVACKYLIPRRRQLSVSIISMISVLVISLVVWLILVFFSVSNGMTQNWIEKMITLIPPVRMVPTKEYYDSYYYQIDSISEASDYTYKSLREKLAAGPSDPYDPDFDEEIPLYWAKADRDKNGNLKDIARLAIDAAKGLDIAGLSVSPHETSTAALHLSLMRGGFRQANISQSAYLGSFDSANRDLKKALQPLSEDDLSNILEMLTISEESPKIPQFFDNAKVTHLKTAANWKVPFHLYPKTGTLEVAALIKEGRVYQMFAAKQAKDLDRIKAGFAGGSPDFKIVRASLTFKNNQPYLLYDKKEIAAKTAPLFVQPGAQAAAKISEASLKKAETTDDLRFFIHIDLQGVRFSGEVPYRGFKIAKADLCPAGGACWAYEDNHQMILPKEGKRDGILLPKNFRDAGVLVGDRGSLAYHTPTTSALQEQRIPVYVAGFYDQGIIPIGGKLIWADPEVIAMTSSAYDRSQGGLETALNVRFDDPHRAAEVKNKLLKALNRAGIGKYWTIETYQEYPYTKDLIQHFRSEKNLFSLISLVIIIVACSNIVSMLIILVNDKKAEIGILLSMGASPKSLAAIFGFCGLVMGLLGSLIGICLAALTLKNIQALIALISHLQGHELFNAHFFGDIIPSDLSGEALGFVLIATVLISLISGIIPAIKASLMKPSQILRSE